MKIKIIVFTFILLISFTAESAQIKRYISKAKGGTMSRKVMIQALEDRSNSEFIRANSASVLSSIGITQDMQILIKYLDDPSEEVRSMCAFALGFLGNNDAVPYLIEKLNGESELVKIRAIRSLGRLCDSNAIEPLLNCLYDKNEDIVSQSILAIGDLCNDEHTKLIVQEVAFSRLIEILKKRKIDIIQSSVMQTLGRLGDKRAIPYLIEILNDKDEYYAMNAAEALVEIGDIAVCEELKKAYANVKDPFVRKKIKKAYKRLLQLEIK